MKDTRKEYTAVVKVVQYYKIVVSAYDVDTAIEIAADDASSYGTPLDRPYESETVSIALN